MNEHPDRILGPLRASNPISAEELREELGAEGLRLAAVRFTTPGAPQLRRSLAARRMVEEAIEGIIVVPPRAALGATLVFELAEGAEG